MNHSFFFEFIAKLNKAKSKLQLKNDIKNLGDLFANVIFKSQKSKSKKQLQRDLAELNNGTINVKFKVDSKSLSNDVRRSTDQAQKKVKPISLYFTLKKDKLINDIKIMGRENSKLFGNSAMSSKYYTLLDNAKLATNTSELKNIRMQLSAMRSEVKATNVHGLNLADTFKRAFRRTVELFGTYGLISMFTRQLRNAWTEALQLDKAFTSLIKVQSSLTRGDYSDYLEQCNIKAKELATTQKELIESATEFSKSGYDLETSNKLSGKSTILSNVGDMSSTDSAKAIISGVQAYETVDGFDDVINKASALIDKYNEIGNTASITTSELAKGVQSVGSVFADSNTTVDEFIALLAAGNRQFQDADSLALGLRTSALRIRGCTTELETMGEETESVITTTSKLAEKIEALTNINGSGGVKILEDDEETFRSIYDIYTDIGKVYKQMSDVDQSALLDLIAGKHRASGISATLNNMTEAQEIYQRSIQSSGSAQNEYDKYLESSEASLNRFKASMTETYQSVIGGETVKGLLNCGNATLEFANSLGLVESSIKGFIAIGIVKAVTTLSAAFKASIVQAINFQSALDQTRTLANLSRGTVKHADALDSLKTASVGLTNAQLKQILASKSLEKSDRIAILRATGLSKAKANAMLAQMGLTQSTRRQAETNGVATVSTLSLSAAVKGLGISLKTAFMSNPVGLSLMALSLIMGAFTSIISSTNQKQEEARQKFKESASAAKEETEKLSSLLIKYNEASSAVKNNSGSKEDLLSVQDELLKSLGIEAAQLDGLIEKYGDLDTAINQTTLSKLEENEASLGVNLGNAEKELLKIGKKNKNEISIDLKLNNSDVIDKIKNIKGLFTSYGGEMYNQLFVKTTGDTSTIEGITANIESLSKLRTEIENIYSLNGNKEELIKSKFYSELTSQINELSTAYDNYNNSIADYNSNQSSQHIIGGLIGEELPKTKNEFEAYKIELIKTAQESGEFIGSQEDIADAIINTLSQMPQFKEYFEDYSKSVKDLTANAPDFKDIFELKDANNNDTLLSGVKDSLSEVENAYNTCLAAKQEYDEQGYMSIDTLEKVVSLGEEYLKYLYDEEGNVRLDAEAFQQLSQARINDMEAQALSNLAANISQIQNESDAVEYLTSKQNELAQSYTDVAANALLALSSVSGFSNSPELTAVYDKFKTQYNQIKGLFSNVRKGVPSNFDGKSKSSSSTDLHKEAFTKELNTLKHNLEMQYITEEEYYNKLESLNNHYFKGKSKYLDEYRKHSEEIFNGMNKYYKQQIEDMMNDSEAQLDAGKITYKKYCDEVSAYLKKMYSDGKLSAEDYHTYSKQMLEKQLSIYDQVLSSVTRRFDTEIQKTQDAIDSIEKQNDALEKQKDKYDSVISAVQELIDSKKEEVQSSIDALEKENDSLNNQVGEYDSVLNAVQKVYEEKQDTLRSEQDAIQDRIDSLQDENDEHKRAIELQKAKRDLARSMYQRDQFTFDGEQFVYMADEQAIKENQEKLADLELEQTISGLEKEKEALQELIDELDRYKEQWSDIANAYQEAKDKEIAKNILGENYTEDILLNRAEDIEAFKDRYVAAQQKIDDNTSMIESSKS